MIHKLTTKNKLVYFYESSGKGNLYAMLLNYITIHTTRSEEGFRSFLERNGFTSVEAGDHSDALDLPI